MAEFEWKVGDDEFEDTRASTTKDVDRFIPLDEPPVAKTRTSTSPWPRRILFALTPLLLFALIASLLAQRVDDASAAQRNDVLALFNLLQDAIAHADADLYRSLISSLDTHWGRAQRDLFDAGLVFERKALGLTLQDAAPHITDIQLSSDLHHAEVHATLAYRVDQGHGASAAVELQHVTHFQLVNQRWQVVAPSSSFWGESIRENTPLINATYPEHDRAIAQRLVYELDQMLSQFCFYFTGSACPPRTHIELELGTNPLLLVGVAQPVAPLSYIADANRQTRFPLYISLPAPTLVGLPLDEAGYAALYRGYAVHLARQVAVTLSSGHRFISVPHLLQSTLDKALIDTNLRVWPPIANDTPNDHPPIPLPDQDVLVLCAGDLAQAGSILRYDPANDLWSTPWPDRAFIDLNSRPHNNEIVLQEEIRVTGETQQRPLILRNGAWIEVAASELIAPSEAIFDSPAGNQMLVELKQPQAAILSRRARDGTQTEIGAGYGPFWLDDQSYGFIDRFGTRVLIASTADDVAQTLIDLDRLRAALPIDLRAGPTIQLSIRNVWPSAANPDVLLIRLYVYNVNSGPFGLVAISGYLFFDYDRRSGTLERRLDGHDLLGNTTPSPNQNWLATETQEQLGQETALLVHDMLRAQTHTFPLFPTYSTGVHWSSDAQWLLAMSDGVLSLIAPAYDYQRNIAPNRPGCAVAVWIDRGS